MEFLIRKNPKMGKEKKIQPFQRLKFGVHKSFKYKETTKIREEE